MQVQQSVLCYISIPPLAIWPISQQYFSFQIPQLLLGTQ